MDNYKELEYKYKADNIELSAFTNLIDSLNPNDRLDVSSWDYYYTTKVDKDMFIRHRLSKHKPELTIKRKVKDTNNWERLEVDVPLSNERDAIGEVNKFCSLLGYEENFRIYKSCFIYFLEEVSAVYYIVYDKSMNEMDRFIEIEFHKELLQENKYTIDKAFDILKDFEYNLNELGITAKNRLLKSLFEYYRK